MSRTLGVSIGVANSWLVDFIGNPIKSNNHANQNLRNAVTMRVAGLASAVHFEVTMLGSPETVWRVTRARRTAAG